MTARLHFDELPPSYLGQLMRIETYLAACGLDRKLLELVRLYASLLNGCAYCIDMHFKDALAAGESPQRLYSLSAWRETSYYSARERAALSWTEAVTRVAETKVPDSAYAVVSSEFNREELANLTLAIAQINTWNRIALAFRVEPGTYEVHSETQ